MFDRDFMDYHSDRFEDFSLLIFNNKKLVGLLPLNRKGDEVYSHQGLSYGGFVFSKKIKLKEVLSICQITLSYLKELGIVKLHYKVMPRIYHSYPADEMEYLFFLLKAQLTNTYISSVIDLQQPLKIQSNRMEGVKKAQKLGLVIKEEADFKLFWEEILIPNLNNKHNASPVHTVNEIELLANRFPKNIKQFNVYHKEKIVGGATIFETPHLVHMQYISGDSNKQRLGSLDFLFHYLISKHYCGKKYFDSGVSIENEGNQLNEGLVYWKESFGARSCSHQSFIIETENYSLLESVFI